MVQFPTRIPDFDFHSPAHLDLFISSEASICSTMASPLLGNSGHIVVSVSIDFSSSSNWDALFHQIAGHYSCGLCDVPWEDIFKCSASAAASGLYEWVQVGFNVYIPHQKYQVKPHSSA